MPVRDQKVEIVGDSIHILRKQFNVMAFATYKQELYEKIRLYTWTPASGYIKSSKLKMSLHKFLMVEKYGEEVIQEAYANDFVIDHINNDGMDCRYTNLALIPSRLNVAKGQTYDIDRLENQHNFAINFSRDEESSEYQISVAFNKHCNFQRGDEVIPITGMYLRYGQDYKTTFLDAQIIVNDLLSGGTIEIPKLHTSKVLLNKAILLRLTEEEMKGDFVMRDGQVFMIQGRESSFTTQLAHNSELHRD